MPPSVLRLVEHWEFEKARLLGPAEVYLDWMREFHLVTTWNLQRILDFCNGNQANLVFWPDEMFLRYTGM